MPISAAEGLMPASLTPAAQYLRMSTDHQQYSLHNQAAAIAHYAALHGFEIVKTYSDAARSGLRLKNRCGLKQLLSDVVNEVFQFRAVLVYDVSRWGRFQDHDEAGHYEYLCKSSGAPVHYCAEPFNDEDGALAWILKTLKRTMAAEYSRELSVKVRTGQRHLATLGYKLGGSAPYGLRRLLLNKEGKPKQLLEFGERKSLSDERVTFISGPKDELAIVKRIFQEFAEQRLSVNAIAARLNSEGIPYTRGTTWKGNTLRIMLQDPRYVGIHVWGRTTALLASPVRRLPVSEWVIHPNAFAAIVPYDLFVRVQEVFANFTIRLTDDQMLDRLRQLRREHGYLSGRIIDNSRSCPGLTTYCSRFGGLMNVYACLGYDVPEKLRYVSLRQKGSVLRSSFISSLLRAFPNQLQLVRRNKRYRPLVRYQKTGLLFSVVFARFHQSRTGRSWIIENSRKERGRPTLLVLVAPTGNTIESMTMLPKLPTTYRHQRVREDQDWLKLGVPLQTIEGLITALTSIRCRSN